MRTRVTVVCLSVCVCVCVCVCLSVTALVKLAAFTMKLLVMLKHHWSDDVFILLAIACSYTLRNIIMQISWTHGYMIVCNINRAYHVIILYNGIARGACMHEWECSMTKVMLLQHVCLMLPGTELPSQQTIKLYSQFWHVLPTIYCHPLPHELYKSVLWQ